VTRLATMLEARSIAVVGASDRPDSFGLRLTTEALRSPGRPDVHLVHPRRREVLGRRCLPSLSDVPDPVDLVLLGVPDSALVEQLSLASARGDAGAVVFGSAAGLAADVTAAAGELEMCGAGCMGFVNVVRGVRAIGYLERHPLPVGPIAMVTHSGSVFSTMLRTHRRLEYSLVVSSGQELTTTTADYLDYALALPETRVIGLVLETLRDGSRLRESLATAAERDVPVVALTVGGSPTGRALVDAHSGAIAGDDAAWEALFDAYGVHRAHDLGELTDSLEAFAIGRRVRRGSTGGVATLHDSGAERALVADVAEHLGVRFAPLTASTRSTLETRLAPGLIPTNPLDVWSTDGDTLTLVTHCLEALATDETVDVVAVAVDLVPEYDGDLSYPTAIETMLDRTDKPLVVLTNLSSAVDQVVASRLRDRGVPVLEGTRSGLRAIGHLLADATRSSRHEGASIDQARKARWVGRLADDRAGADALGLVADYGLPVVAERRVSSVEEAIAAAGQIGYPVVLKTATPDVRHKVDVDGVRLGLTSPAEVRAAYAALESRLGAEMAVQRHVDAGVELALGIVRDPLVGPLIVVAAGGTLVELLSERAVALPPVDQVAAADLLGRLTVGRMLAGHRGRPAVNRGAVHDAVVAMSQLAIELGDQIEAVDVNPLIVSADGAVAVDALVVRRDSA
jgi:acetate---CoA ligase (ADP-forming)